MSLVVLYEGQRKVVKIPSPNTLVQVLLVEAAQHFTVDPKVAVLKHKKTVLDASQPFRFCNLSNNAQIDLVVTGSTASAKKQLCRIALAVDGCDNVTESFEASVSLGELITSLVSSGKLPSDAMERSPELIYLRANYAGSDALFATTLASLGLAGQSARLQLRFGCQSAVGSPRSTNNTTDAVQASTSTKASGSVSPARTNTTMDVGALSSAVSTGSADAATAMEVVVDTETPVSPHSTPTHSRRPSAAPRETPAPPHSMSAEPAVIIPGTGVISSIFTSTHGPALEHVPPVPPVLPTPTHCMDALLADNFDAASIPAVITLSKYLINIMLYPEEGKYRKISTENKLFVSKVLTAKGALQFLYSVGFTPHGASALILVPHGPSTDQGTDAATALSPVQLGTLSEGWTALQRAMTELEIPAEDRPSVVDARTLQAQREQRLVALQQQQAAFDPFKSHIVRAAPQPVRQHEVVPTSSSSSDSSSGGNVSGGAAATMTLSATERQLQELQRKRTELEGRPEDVQRLTEVLFPRADGSVANLADFTDEPVNSNSSGDVYNEDDSRSAPRSVLAKILKRSADGEDNTPLTTQAVRDLQKAQKERVYSRTLIRIKLPDRLCLQGYFHPRHTLADVYAWVYQCLSQSLSQTSQDRSGITAQSLMVAAALQCFELYTSPPRTVLFPYAPASADKRPTGCGLVGGPVCDSIATLSDLKLVPAALIYLTWKVSPEGNMKEGASMVPGHYLQPELLTIDSAGGKVGADSNSSGTTGSTAYPTGCSLVPNASSDGTGGGAAGGGELSGDGTGAGRRIAPGKSSAEGGGDAKKMSKPKWFK